MYITSPGLNAVMEGLELNKPMIFLPPQNASQVLQLDRYEKAGIVPSGMNLPNYVNQFSSLNKDVLDEKYLTDEVLEALAIIMKSPSIKKSLAMVLDQQIRNIESEGYQKATYEFKASLWPPGAKCVAEYINSWWHNEFKRY